MPFVSEHPSRGWQYHLVVRAVLLRMKRRQSPEDWICDHERLAGFYVDRQRAVHGQSGRTWSSDAWVEDAQAEVYHRLCARPSDALPECLERVIRTLEPQLRPLIAWGETFAQAAADTESEETARWSRMIRAAGE